MTAGIMVTAALLAMLDVQASPSPTPDPAEIGRVKARLPACVALREIVAPSFGAARRADAAFVEASTALAAYAEARASGTTLPTNVVASSGRRMGSKRIAADPFSARPEALLARLDSEFSTMQQEALVISKALGDKRMAPDIEDDAVQRERTQLQRIYDAQVARLSAIQIFLEHERKRLIGQRSREAAKRATGVDDDIDTTATDPAARQVATSYGQPSLNGLPESDKRAVRDWTRFIIADVATKENAAAKTFLDVGGACK